MQRYYSRKAKAERNNKQNKTTAATNNNRFIIDELEKDIIKELRKMTFKDLNDILRIIVYKNEKANRNS